jgi:hypothetical protein
VEVQREIGFGLRSGTGWRRRREDRKEDDLRRLRREERIGANLARLAMSLTCQEHGREVSRQKKRLREKSCAHEWQGPPVSKAEHRTRRFRHLPDGTIGRQLAPTLSPVLQNSLLASHGLIPPLPHSAFQYASWALPEPRIIGRRGLHSSEKCRSCAEGSG